MMLQRHSPKSLSLVDCVLDSCFFFNFFVFSVSFLRKIPLLAQQKREHANEEGISTESILSMFLQTTSLRCSKVVKLFALVCRNKMKRRKIIMKGNICGRKGLKFTVFLTDNGDFGDCAYTHTQGEPHQVTSHQIVACVCLCSSLNVESIRCETDKQRSERDEKFFFAFHLGKFYCGRTLCMQIKSQPFARLWTSFTFVDWQMSVTLWAKNILPPYGSWRRHESLKSHHEKLPTSLLLLINYCYFVKSSQKRP